MNEEKWLNIYLNQNISGYKEIDVIHKKTKKKYELILITNIAASFPNNDYPLTAVYRDEDGIEWSRPLSVFAEKFEVA